MDDEDQRQNFVSEKHRAGWTKGAIKTAFRKEFGRTPNNEVERRVRAASQALSTATESDSKMASALELYRRWTAIGNVIIGQLRSRERIHKSLGIPPPAEMLHLERDWGKSAPPARKAVEQLVPMLQELLASIPPDEHTDEAAA
jgi:hypothetical protein